VKKKPTEYDTFENLASQIIRVPRSEVKAKLDAEKRAKERKKPKKTE